jgi:hypothetical protein
MTILITVILIFLVSIVIFSLLVRKVKKIIATAFFLLFLAISATSFYLSEKPFLCRECHEIKPYYEAWKYSPHKDVSCLSCHSEEGIVSVVKVKYRGLRNALKHFTEEKISVKTNVSEKACLNCHSKDKKFCTHTERKDCLSCHKKSGHPLP